MEYDFLGERNISDSCYYGINTLRAIENFGITGRPIHFELVKAIILIKKAAAATNSEIGILDKDISGAIIKACDEVLQGSFANQFPVDCMQGGAGTSANMNVNEVLANRAIELLGGQKGEYSIVHPIDHVNLSQSTNDVFPTAVRIAAIKMLTFVSELFADLQSALQAKEEEFSRVLKVGRTELQDAVPITLGQEFGAWAQAISRDRWRLYKVEERLRQVNLGGTAVGTGLNAEKKYIFLVIEKLRELTGLGLARSEYMMDTTQNTDVFVEVSGLLKTAAVNLSKIASDLRLLSSGPKTGIGEIILPQVQAGSSIMPGKVNPVIPEALNQIAFRIMGNDLAITIAAQSGQLELNAFLPLIADNLFEMLDLLKNGIRIFIDKCINGIKADKERCMELVEKSHVLATGLIGHIGYDAASELVKKCMSSNKTIRQEIIDGKILEEELISLILNPLEMTKPGIPGKKKGRI